MSENTHQPRLISEPESEYKITPEEQARKDAHDREAIVASLREQLKRGDKSLVGNRGFRKYLKQAKSKFEIDEKKIKQEARYDGNGGSFKLAEHRSNGLPVRHKTYRTAYLAAKSIANQLTDPVAS